MTIITIDGPAGSGKSTAARGLAERLGFEFLDTGAMYRAVALAAHRAQIHYESPEVDALVRTLRIGMGPEKVLIGNKWVMKVLLNGEDVTHLLRTPELASGASKVAVKPAVRECLIRQQRDIARDQNMVCEGRDQGTVVFPNAICKFYMDASPESRAQRRLDDLRQRGHQVDFAEVLQLQRERDLRDTDPSTGRLQPPPDAIRLDSSSMTPDQVVQWMEERVRQRWSPG